MLCTIVASRRSLFCSSFCPQEGAYVIVQHPVMQNVRDHILVERDLNSSRNYAKTKPLTYENSLNGDTYFDREAKLITYMSE